MEIYLVLVYIFSFSLYIYPNSLKNKLCTYCRISRKKKKKKKSIISYIKIIKKIAGGTRHEKFTTAATYS